MIFGGLVFAAKEFEENLRDTGEGNAAHRYDGDFLEEFGVGCVRIARHLLSQIGYVEWITLRGHHARNVR